MTNLESRERLERERDEAQANVDGNPGNARALATLDAALTRLVDHDRTMARIRQEYGCVVIGEPRGTEYRTAEAIKADGHIGIYLEGAGHGKNAVALEYTETKQGDGSYKWTVSGWLRSKGKQE